jgi:hypothetical protein
MWFQEKAMIQPKGFGPTRALVVAALAYLLGAPAFASDPDANAKDVKVLVLGPFRLGDVYDKMPDQTLAGWEDTYKHLKERFTKMGGPPHAEVVKALNLCKLYVIERTVMTKWKGKWVRDFLDDREPLLLGGKLSFDVQGQKGRKLSVRFKRAKCNKEVVVASQEPYHKFNSLTIELTVDLFEGNRLIRRQELRFVSLDFFRDVNGKVWWEDPAKQ